MTAIRRTPRLSLLTLSAALALAGFSGLSAAADNTAAVQRALAHVQANPERSGHGADHSYSARDVVVDADGSEHVRLERRFRGLRVIGGDMVVHSRGDGSLRDVSRSLVRPLALDTQPRLDAAQAGRIALAQRAGTLEGAPTLVVHARGERPQLAWDVLVHGTQADGTPSEEHVIVDARSGAELDTWNDIHTVPKTGTALTLFSGQVDLPTDRRFNRFGKYSMKDLSRGGQYTTDMNNSTSGAGKVYKDQDNAWGNGAVSDRATVGADAHFGMTMTWDYFLQVHGRNGIANDGVGAYSRTHYGNNYANAFWSDSCFCMTYGDGNSQIWPLTSIDVAGHEMAHGVTSRTAGLIYSGESGGLNEATSDIFGAMVEYFANNPQDTPDYIIGEEIFKTSGFIRDMRNPSVDGVSADCWYAGVGNIDVHYSSGVANHFFYLLAEGTTAGVPSKTCVAGNTKVATGNGTLTGIGRDKAAKIWYRALTVYLTQNSNYAAARTATINAANDLYGAPEAAAVAAAWTAVNRP